MYARGLYAVRRYSTEPKNLFLSDLLSRIDRISDRSASIKSEQAKVREPPKKSRFEPAKKRNAKVNIGDHPLFTSSFNLEKPKPKTQRTQKPQKERAPRPKKDAKKRKPVKRIQSVDSSKIESKTIKATSLHPQVSGNTFLYGKVPGVDSSVTSKVASVTKEMLIASKFPFNIPREIVDNLDKAPRNKFLLQRNFTLDIAPQVLGKRINEVVRGKWEELTYDASKVKNKKHAEAVREELMRNSGLSMENKRKLFEAATGAKSPQKLVEGAVWTK